MSTASETRGVTPPADRSTLTTPVVLLGREMTESVSLHEPTEAEPELLLPSASAQPEPDPNIWEQICQEFAAQRPPFRTTADEPSETSSPKTPPPRISCSPREYLEYYIFPVLLPVLEDLLRQAKLEKCFERKRTKFNALDFLTEHLYKKNPNHTNRDNLELEDIPFVKEHWKDHPRPPLPMSLLWTEEEATLIVQNFWRGYLVRREPEVQELRQWQREWRQENENINEMVSDFWAKQMPNDDLLSPSASLDLENDDNPQPHIKQRAASQPTSETQEQQAVSIEQAQAASEQSPEPLTFPHASYSTVSYP